MQDGGTAVQNTAALCPGCLGGQRKQNGYWLLLLLQLELSVECKTYSPLPNSGEGRESMLDGRG